MGDGRDAWLAEVSEWVTGVVTSLGLGTVAAITPVRERLWGAVARVTTPDRVLYFKAEGPGGHHEPAVLAELRRTWPDLVPDVMAEDREGSWLLLADHGQATWDVLDAEAQVAAFE